MMMLINLCLLLMLIKCSFSKTSIINSSIIDLYENSPINTLVVSLNSSIKYSNKIKFVLLNLNGYETTKFIIKNGNLYTLNEIDREEFIEKKYCLDNSYCKIEIHILVNNGFEYLIIPIHIIDENDNKPSFREKEIELKFRENILNGYKIPFEGAKDSDEGKLDYFLDCSNNSNELLNNCLPLFQLIIISQSYSLNYDQLALKFVPSSLINIENEYKLKVYAIDKNNNKNLIYLNIKIEQKDKILKFSSLKYEFIILLNSSLNNNNNSNLIGRVYAISNNSFDRIYYKINNNNKINYIEINSLTGQLTFLNKNYLINNQFNDEILFDVQASILSFKNNSSKLLTNKTKVKIYFRYFNLLNNIYFKFQIYYKNKNLIIQLNNSNSFFIDKNIEINQNLFEIFIISYYYPSDKYILYLQNYLNIFSLSSSSSSSNSLFNSYSLKTRQHLISTSIYLLNIGVKHKLSQQWLSNLTIELIIVDQWTSTTTTTIRETNFNTTSINFQLTNESSEFCIKNKSYILYEINKNKKNKIILLKVIKTNLNLNLNLNKDLFIFENESEIIINKCQMFIDELINFYLNKSLKYELCSLSSSSIINKCYNIKIKDEINLKLIKNKNKRKNLFFSIKLIELIMLIVSIIFILITIILLLLICKLKQINICLKLKNYLFYKRSNSQQDFSSFKIKKRINSIGIDDSYASSFQSIEIKNDPYIFNIDDLLEQEPISPSNVFYLPSIEKSSSSITYSIKEEEDNIIRPPRTSSSSSFLQETKQLLEMISNNQNFDLSKLVSEV